MRREEIKETAAWSLYEKGRNFHRQMGIYTDSDRNYRFYNGNQWEGAKFGDIEPVQKNFIKPIVRYKVSVIHSNLYAIIYSSGNFENRAFRKEAERYCAILNGYAAKVWERDKMDYKGRRLTKDSAINGEGILYVDFDREEKLPRNEILKKSDVYYGNENDEEIQNQPYILLRKRMPHSGAVELAERYGLSEEKTRLIVGDSDNFEESGDDAKYEVDDMVTVLYKFYKEKGTVRFSVATRYVDLCENQDTKLTLYPIAHFNWEEKEGSARGEGEVRQLIPNQIEVNRTEMRRVLTVKLQAYPKMVADVGKITNPEDLDTVGGTIKVEGMTVDDVRKVVGSLSPAHLSPDVRQLEDDLINGSRDLAGAGEYATGQANPETASGRAILAVQQASEAPMTEQREGYKNFIEDVAKIWLEYLIVHSSDGIIMWETVTDEATGEELPVPVKVTEDVLRGLSATVRIDVTPKGVYDRFAQEQTIENLLMSGLLSVNRVGELEIYAKLLDDDSVAPKGKILDAVSYIKDQQKQIAELQANTETMLQRAKSFFYEDPDTQARRISEEKTKAAIKNAANQKTTKREVGKSSGREEANLG